jgi:GNAT superfamily N-acetyltransferase
MTGTAGTVRHATSQDLLSLLEIDRNSPVGHEREELLTARVRSKEVIVFESGDRILGYAVLRPSSFFGRDFVELLVVTEIHRRHGIGSLLLKAAVSLASTERTFTSTNRSNSAMIGLLQKAGWHSSGQLYGIDQGDPELVYYKDAP